ncbi:nucleotidyltransferase [Candidatus Dependentiae bacterium]|nr:nucleotidyltransferase [Candidatus Dependentiae bacterium]
MEKIKSKYENLSNALARLEEAVIDFEKFNANIKDQYDVRLYRTFRDSMIQRFELCVDLFWKYLKIFLEKKLQRPPEFHAPKSIIREACNSRLISEQDAEHILKMIEDRNMSSHIYKEEVADQISAKIPEYYKIMKSYIDKMV